MRPPIAAFDTCLKSLIILLAVVSLSGCATMPLDRARSEFHAGRFEDAETSLIPLPKNDKDQVLFLMERGMVRQALGKYEKSAADWRAAEELNELLETYSISRGAASMLASDRVLSFRGKPFERTLLFTFLANNYLALHNWDYAAICARNIIQHLENREGFPDIAYSRYMAGLCLELIGDTGNAALQYRIASELLPDIDIDEGTGRIMPVSGNDGNSNHNDANDAPYEFICFVAMGSAADSDGYCATAMPYAEIYHDGNRLGRAYTFNNTGELWRKTEKQLALLQLAKDISRIAVKETIARSLEKQNELLGFLSRLTLFALESPDTRRWETLPLWLGIARLPCHEPPESYTIIFRDGDGRKMLTKNVSSPISRRNNIFISFCRDIPFETGQADEY